MNANELREKTVDELKVEYKELLREQFNLRMQKASSALNKTHLIKEVRRNIARVLTILHEKIGK